MKDVGFQDLTPLVVALGLVGSVAFGGDGPSCTRGFAAATSTAEIVVDVAAAAGMSQGLRGARLADGALNLVLKEDPTFLPGDERLEVLVQPINRFLDASGMVVGEDAAGGTCALRVDIRAIFNRTNPTRLCEVGDIGLRLRNPRIRNPGNAACSITDLGPGEPALPPGYAPLPGSAFDPFPCRVLTVDSPFGGLNELILAKAGRFQPGERLLASVSTDGGLTFPPFADVTAGVARQGTFRPVTTEWTGLETGTPFKVTCALAPAR